MPARKSRVPGLCKPPSTLGTVPDGDLADQGLPPLAAEERDSTSKARINKYGNGFVIDSEISLEAHRRLESDSDTLLYEEDEPEELVTDVTPDDLPVPRPHPHQESTFQAQVESLFATLRASDTRAAIMIGLLAVSILFIAGFSPYAHSVKPDKAFRQELQSLGASVKGAVIRPFVVRTRIIDRLSSRVSFGGYPLRDTFQDWYERQLGPSWEITLRLPVGFRHPQRELERMDRKIRTSIRRRWRSISRGVRNQQQQIRSELDGAKGYLSKVASIFVRSDVGKKDNLAVDNVQLKAEVRRMVAEEFSRLMRSQHSPMDALRKSIKDLDDLANAVNELVASDGNSGPDYALFGAGGRIVASSPSYGEQFLRFLYDRSLGFLGVRSHLVYRPKRPLTAISPGVLPGDCWAFPGSRANLTIALGKRIVPSMFTMEHTPRKSAVSISSAPREFHVYGVTAGEPDQLLGTFSYSTSEMDRYLQRFSISEEVDVRAVGIVRLEILSNQDKESSYTCLYRFRVHGFEA